MRYSPGLYIDWKFCYGAPTDVSLMLHEQVIELIKYVSQRLTSASAPQVLNFLQLKVWLRNRSHQLRISALVNHALRQPFREKTQTQIQSINSFDYKSCKQYLRELRRLQFSCLFWVCRFGYVVQFLGNSLVH